MSSDTPLLETRLALFEQAQTTMNGKLDTLLVLAQATSGRLTDVENQQLVYRATGIAELPTRVRTLEDVVTELRGVARIAKWAVGGGLLGALALLAQLLQAVK